jgi:puromycin-sensitive aminopeptidase
LVNAGGWGVYRTRYDDESLAAIAADLGGLDPLERATLVSDAWAATLAGRQRLGSFLGLAAALGDAIEPATWSVVLGALSTVDLVADEPARVALAPAVRTLLRPLFDALGWDPIDGEDEQAPTLRASVISGLGIFGGDEEVIAEALRRFDADEVTGDVASAIIGIVGAAARPGDLETMTTRWRTAPDPQSEHRYLFGLAGFHDVASSLATFDLARSEVRSQDAPYLVGRLLTNRVGGPAVWQRLTETFDECLERFPNDAHSRMLSGISRLAESRALAESVVEFVAAHPIHSGQRTVLQEAERLMVVVSFGETEGPTLEATLAAVAEAR